MSLSGSPGYPALSLTSMPWCGTAVGHHQWDICFFVSFLNFILREFSGGPRLGLCVSTATGTVLSLVRELKSCMLGGIAKKKRK